MPALDLNDLDAYLEAFGDLCAKGASSFKAIIDTPEEGIFGGEVVTAFTTMTYKTSAASLVHKDAITVSTGFAAGSYKVNGPPRRIGDGAFSIADLESA